jgi:hypothetical protein
MCLSVLIHFFLIRRRSWTATASRVEFREADQSLPPQEHLRWKCLQFVYVPRHSLVRPFLDRERRNRRKPETPEHAACDLIVCNISLKNEFFFDSVRRCACCGDSWNRQGKARAFQLMHNVANPYFGRL